jgi:hypothetical protein
MCGVLGISFQLMALPVALNIVLRGTQFFKISDNGNGILPAFTRSLPYQRSDISRSLWLVSWVTGVASGPLIKSIIETWYGKRVFVAVLIFLIAENIVSFTNSHPLIHKAESTIGSLSRYRNVCSRGFIIDKYSQCSSKEPSITIRPFALHA